MHMGGRMTTRAQRKMKKGTAMKNKGVELQQQANRLLEEALKQPGVADAMRVYQSFKPITDVLTQYNHATYPRVAFTGSDSSTLRQ